MKKIFEEGFSLSEALIFLLITCLVMIATMPLITIRHIKLPERAPHGKWACKLINGQMYSATAANVNAKLPPDEKWKKGCTFPELPSSVSYVIVQAIGGGASGRQGDMTIGSESKTVDLFPSDEDKSVYTVEETGKYRIYFPGESGKRGYLTPAYFDVMLNGFKYMSCAFDSSLPNSVVPSVTFDYDLKRGDKLVLDIKDSDTQNKFNNSSENLCDSSRPILAQWVDEHGVSHTEPYKFQSVKHKPGNNGKIRILSLQDGANTKNLVEIKGSGGGYYASSTDSCNIDCSRRYTALYDRAMWKLEDYIKTSSDAEFQKSFSSNKTAKISSQGHTLSYYGGCGGAAGQVNTVVVEKPDKSNIEIKIGKGGINGGDGEDTVFDYIVASGGIGCADNGVNASVNGTDGGSANTMAALDSVGGKGGDGKIGLPLLSYTQMKGQDATGLGSGGGGGGIALKINKPIEEYLNNSLIYQLENYKELGAAGNGASGGVIVSW